MGSVKDIEIKIPNLGEAEETEVIEVSVKVGDKVNTNDPLIVLESEKAAMEVPSDHDGTIKAINIKEGENVKEGQPFLILEVSEVVSVDQEEQKKPDKEIVEKVPEARQSQSIDFTGINAGPAVRKVARELDIDLTQIKGTGKNSMVTKEDLKSYLKQNKTLDLNNYANLEDLKKYGDYELIKQSKIQNLGAKNLHKAWLSIPHVTHFEELNITNIEDERKQINESLGIRLTPLAYIVKFVCEALKEFPEFNSSLIGEGEIVLKKYINMGIAVDTDNGLVVPVIKNADKLSVEEVADEIRLLSEKAKTKKLLANDLSGATFTISSLGNMGGVGFTPIINPPEVAIIGVSRAKHQLVMENDQVVKNTILPLSLSYDHRVINGADAGRFMSFIRNKNSINS